MWVHFEQEGERMKRYKVTGLAAHGSKPRKAHDFVRVVRAKDAVHAMYIYRKKLRGVKKYAPLSVEQVAS